MLMVSETMTTIEKNLSSSHFVRVHKSYIVSIKKINEIRGNIITIGKTNIPIGSTYKIYINQVIEKFNLKK